MSHYRNIIIETYKNLSGGSSQSIRARPLADQGFDTSMNVECSSSMRKSHKVGTRFLISAKPTNREGGPEFLYSHFNSPYQVLSDKEAEEYIEKNV